MIKWISIRADRFGLGVLLLFGAEPAVRAHRLDECLQAALISISTREIGIDLSLTPGALIGPEVLGEIDKDHDRIVSPIEGKRYLDQVTQDISISVDGKAVRLELEKYLFPTVESLLQGTSAVEIKYRVVPANLRIGHHTLELENRHNSTNSQYLMNVLEPDSSRVQILRQRRNEIQSKYEVEFAVNPPGVAATFWAGATCLLMATLALLAVLWERAKLARI